MFSISKEISDSEFSQYITPFCEIVSFSDLERTLAQHKRNVRANPYTEFYLRSRHSLQFSIHTCIERMRTFGAASASQQTHLLPAVNFIVSAVDIYKNLSPQGQAIFRGRIKDALNTDVGLMPLNHELLVASHLSQLDCSLEANDIENGGGFDYLVAREGALFEVECKTVTGDKGRKIHAKDILVLSDSLTRHLDWKAIQRIGRAFGVRATFADRINKESGTLRNLVGAINTAISEGLSSIEVENCLLELITLPIADTPFRSSTPQNNEHTMAFVEQCGFDADAHTLARISPDHCAFILVARSRERDQILDRIYEELKHSVITQFSGERPAILAVCLADLHNQELQLLAGPEYKDSNALTAIANRLFKDTNSAETRSHLHSVTFTAAPGLARVFRDGAMNLTGTTYRFINKNHLHK